MPQKGLPLRTFAIFLLAAVIGVAGGVLGSFFQRGLNLLQEWLTGGSGAGMSEAVRENLSWWQALLVPTIGGLAAGSVLMLLRGKRPPWRSLRASSSRASCAATADQKTKLMPCSLK